jgi:integrase
MGSTIRRGTRDRPRWYGKYRDVDGHWKMRALLGATTKEDAKKALAAIETNVFKGIVGLPKRSTGKTFEATVRDWMATLKNRAADKYKGACSKYLIPAFPGTLAAAQEVSAVLVWVDKLRATKKLSEGSVRRLLTVLSAFWTWANERGLATSHPIRLMPKSARPKRSVRKTHTRWLKADQDDVVWRVMDELDDPFDLAFWLGNRSGLRPGELAGLRMKDLDGLDAGVINVSHSFNGPLKEDRVGDKFKLVPAPLDAVKMLGPLLKKRRREGAGPEDVVFKYMPTTGRSRKVDAWEGMTLDAMNERWSVVRTKVPEVAAMRWTDATRHSYISRCLAAGASMDEVSESVGHSSVLITRASYDHFARESFSPELRAALSPRAVKTRK